MTLPCGEQTRVETVRPGDLEGRGRRVESKERSPIIHGADTLPSSGSSNAMEINLTCSRRRRIPR